MMRKRNGSRRWVWRESEDDEDDDWGCGETKTSKSRTTEKEGSPSMEEDFLAMKSSSNPLWMKWIAWICDGQRGGGNVYLGILPPVYWREQTIVNNTEVGGRDPEEYRMSKINSRCVHRIVNGTWLAGEGCHNRNC